MARIVSCSATVTMDLRVMPSLDDVTVQLAGWDRLAISVRLSSFVLTLTCFLSKYNATSICFDHRIQYL